MATTASRRPTSTGDLRAPGPAGEHRVEQADKHDPRYQAFALMRLAFTVAPIAFGLDKFANVLVHWPTYLAPWIDDLVPGTGQQLMYAVGVVEVLAGVLVALKPRYGAYVVAGWLAGIIVDLVTASGFYDIALRDLGLLLGALALGRLASVYDPPLGSAAADPAASSVQARRGPAELPLGVAAQALQELAGRDELAHRGDALAGIDDRFAGQGRGDLLGRVRGRRAQRVLTTVPAIGEVVRSARPGYRGGQGMPIARS